MQVNLQWTLLVNFTFFTCSEEQVNTLHVVSQSNYGYKQGEN